MSASFSRFLKIIYVYCFLFDFIICYAIYAAFFTLSGISILDIGLLLAFWSGSAIILEVFSGALSDWLDRSWLLIAAPLLKIGTFICWALADGNFWVFGFGFLFWSAGQSLYSGTLEALLYERAAHEGKEDDYDEYYGKANAAEKLGTAAGVLLGGFVAAWSVHALDGMVVTFWLSIPPLLVASLIAIRLTDIRLEAEDEEDLGYWQNIGSAFAEFKRLPELRFITLYIAIGLILFEELEEFYTVYYVVVDLPLWLFGVVGAVGIGIAAIFSAYAHRLNGHQALGWTLPALGGVLFIVSSFADHAAYVIVLELAYLVAIPAAILSEARFQQVIEGQSRATTTSILYLIQNIMALSVAFLFGWLAQQLDLLSAFGWAGVILLFISAWMWWMIRNGHKPFS
ncbi:MAG: MFS transporter [Alphaproteobacteria bacterium]|nr:MFS transporter [Alphaproteobacteria bacterium]